MNVFASTDRRPVRTPRRGSIFACVALTITAVLTADAGVDGDVSFDQARSHYLHGRYDEAIQMLEELGRSSGGRVRAACARSLIDLQRGTLDEGIARLESLASEGRSSADWHAALAALLDERGKSGAAIEHARAALRLDDGHLQARVVLGRVYERLGRIDDALKIYAFFDDWMTTEELPDSPEQLTLLGLGFYRYTVLTRHNLVQRVRHILREVYQEVFDFLDEDYWPARLAAAELLYDRHNLDDAVEEFETILKQNPNVPDAHVGIGRVLLERWDFEGVEEKANAALAIDPHHVGALVLLGDCRMTERRFADAAAFAERALEANPESIEAMGLLAAAKVRLGDRDGARALEARAAALNPKPAALHYAIGVGLSAGRQYEEAADHLRRAAEYAPWWSEPLVDLGLLYMESGHEDQARAALEKAHDIDSFNQRTFAVLGLLDEIDKFAKLETDHFIIKFDRKSDAIAAPYFSSVLEGMHDEICAAYDTQLDRKTFIEMLPTHELFSLRVSHRPFIATIGACTGPLIAIMAPRGRPPFGFYNWADVLRHEFTHTVTLAATKNRIPHWLTEGLAVLSEPAPRSWGQKYLLTTAVRSERLFRLENIDWGFMRPRFPDARAQAYAQSEWMVEFIVEKHGRKAIKQLLEAFKSGKTQEAAFRDVLKTECADFDAAFAQWANRQVDAWNLPWLDHEDVDAVKKLVDAEPGNSGLMARLAAAHWADGKMDDAESWARRALKRNGDEPVALEVMARVLIGRMLAEEGPAKRRRLVDDADPFLRRLHRVAPNNPIAVKYLGYVEQAWEQWPEAIDLYLAYQARYPEDPDVCRRLAAIYAERRDDEGVRAQLEKLAALVPNDPFVIMRVAEAYADSDPARAVQWLRRGLHVNPFDTDLHGALADAALAAGELAAAEREYRVITEILPDDPIGYDGLAAVFRRQGNLNAAETYEKRARALGGGGGAKTPEAAETPH